MGYYTSYTTVRFPSNINEEQMRQFESENPELESYALDFQMLSEDNYLEPAKYYEMEDAFKALSLLFPGELLVIEATGEELGDIYRLAALNGEIETIRPIWPEPTLVNHV